MTDLVSASCSASSEAAPFRWRCPLCGGAVRLAAAEARCAAEEHTFARQHGIWRFLPEPSQQRYAEFARQYDTVRAAERWGKPEAQYYRRLPEVAAGDPQRRIWRQRARSFQALLERVLLPLETARRRPLTVLDLGAGNCWLAHRLARRGHHVAAVDVRTGDLDGLGAHVWYADGRTGRAAFLPVEAEFDRLPFAGAQVDLVVFNAALHYAADYRATISEALRVLRPDGHLVIMDSPVYRAHAAGVSMVREREEDFQQLYGFRSNALPSEHFLTHGRLQSLAAALNLRWQVVTLPSRWRCLVRAWKARWRGRREPAQFPLIVGERAFWPAVPSHSRPRRVLRRWLRRWQFRLFQRHRYDRLVLEQVAGVPLLVLPAVFNPKLLHSGEFLARCLSEPLVPADGSVLDLGTGTGIGAIVAARWARHVMAVDLNPAAVRCARINVLLQHCEDRVEVRQGDLFAPVEQQRFDLVLFNPPYFRGLPRDALDMAWRSPDMVERFAGELAGHLAPGGSALVVLSTVGETLAYLEAFQRHGLRVAQEATRDLIHEALLLFRLTPSGLGGATMGPGQAQGPTPNGRGRAC